MAESTSSDRLFCERCGKAFAVQPDKDATRLVTPCPTCGVQACAACRVSASGPCLTCRLGSPSPITAGPIIRSAPPILVADAPARPRSTVSASGSRLHVGLLWSMLSLVAVILISVVASIALLGFRGWADVARGGTGSRGAVAGASAVPSAVPPSIPVASPTRSPSATPSRPVVGPGDDPLVVEAAFTRAWRIGPNTRGVLLTVLRNAGTASIDVPPASIRYQVRSVDGAAAASGVFPYIVPQQVPAGARAYGVAVLPARIENPRKLGQVAVAPVSTGARSDAPSLAVVDLVWSVDKDGQPRAAGTVTNMTGQRIRAPFVAVVFFDGRDRPVAVLYDARIDGLAAGASASFGVDEPITAPIAPDAIVRVESFAYDLAGSSR